MPKNHAYARSTSDHPLAYFITFHTYGTWLHGNDRGSVDRDHNAFGDPRIPPNRALESHRSNSLSQPPLVLSPSQRILVDTTCREVCTHRRWNIRALNVRSTHLHIVVGAASTPERVKGDLKRWSTRRLREAALIDSDRRVWVDHGSTRYLWEDASVFEVCDYVLNRQD